MPRTKGSKNKPKITNDFVSKIAEKQESIASLTAEITSITANIDTLKADLKEKKAALKTSQKELTKLEAKKAAADQKAAEAAKKSEAEAVLKKLLAEGVSADDIIEKLKQSFQNPKPCGRSYKIPSIRFSNGAIASYRTKCTDFQHYSPKSCPAKFQQKRQQRSAFGQSKRPGGAPGPGRSELYVP